MANIDEKKIPVGGQEVNIVGRFHDVSEDHVVTGANEIFDDALCERQSQINSKLKYFTKMAHVRIDAEEITRGHEDEELRNELNAKQLEIGAVETDSEPIPESPNMLPSGAVAFNLGWYRGNENPEWLYVITDGAMRVLAGIKSDGSVEWNAGVPTPVKDYIEECMAKKVDKEEGRSLIDKDYADGVYYIDNPEFVSVYVDNDGRILEAVMKNGTKFLPAGIKIDSIVSETIDNPEFSIVWLFGNKIIFGIKRDGTVVFGAGIPSQIIDYVDKKTKMLEGFPENTDLKAYLEDVYGEYFINPEWMYVIIDRDDRILGGFKEDGSFEYLKGVPSPIKAFVNESLTSKNEDYDEFIDLKLDSDEKILEATKPDGTKIINGGLVTPAIELSEEGLEKLKDDLDISGSITESSKEVANGNLRAFGTYQSELEASPLNNNADDFYIGYHTVNKLVKPGKETKAVAGFNHDDLNPSDYIGNRKIHNKFGFSSNYNFILMPFVSKSQMDTMKKNVSRLLNDGNTLGLHAVMGSSYFFINRLFDVKPDGGSLFAPTLSDIQGGNPDHTGTNGFGDTITATTRLGDMGYESTELVVNATQQLIKELNTMYTHYGNADAVNGLDLEDNAVVKTRTGWLEYWYNNLVDDSLGYSSSESVIADKFAEDYEVPTGADPADYYPDAAHLRTGKVVFFDDTTNPHYSDSSYQKVGRFKKGLFKGCASCCNYEVLDRCIEVAAAFIKHYFGIDGFVHYGWHGVRYFSGLLTYNGVKYMDTSHLFAYNVRAGLYSTRLGTFIKPSDILLSKGIKYIYDRSQSCVCEDLLYSGCKDRLPEYHNGYAYTNYLNCFGASDSDGSDSISYNDFMTFMEGVDNWSKFLYDNAGKTLTRNGKTFKVFTFLRSAIAWINSSIGTGLVPVFGWDTIHANPSESVAIDLLLRYCYQNDIKVVPVETARAMAHTAPVDVKKDNYFVNPDFEQSILRTVGDVGIALPDGWNIEYSVGSPSLGVNHVTGSLDGATSLGDEMEFCTRIYSLPEGNYTLSMDIKKSGSYFVKVYKMLNSSHALDNDTLIAYFEGGSDYQGQTVDFTVGRYHRNGDDASDIINQVCDGYEDNFAYLHIDIWCADGGTVSIKNCSLTKND